MTRSKFIVVVTVIATALVTSAAPGVAEPASNAPVYLALGDSWAYGQGATDPGTGGYVPRLHEALRADLDCVPAQSDRAVDGCDRLELVNLARPATDTLPGVTAPHVTSEQLPIAKAWLERNHDANPTNDVEVITLHVGGNDVSGPIQYACIGGFDGGCVGTIIAEMTAFAADLHHVVGELRTAAGADTPIVLGTYGNPVPYCQLAGIPGAIELGWLVLEGTPDGSLPGVHDIVRTVAATYGATVAETTFRLGTGDFVGGADCLHPTDSGYEKVTESFREALGL
jgi:lysophospholipase L1-like esterase